MINAIINLDIATFHTNKELTDINQSDDETQHTTILYRHCTINQNTTTNKKTGLHRLTIYGITINCVNVH